MSGYIIVIITLSLQ